MAKQSVELFEYLRLILAMKYYLNRIQTWSCSQHKHRIQHIYHTIQHIYHTEYIF
jgi:hypothetical protein